MEAACIALIIVSVIIVVLIIFIIFSQFITKTDVKKTPDTKKKEKETLNTKTI